MTLTNEGGSSPARSGANFGEAPEHGMENSRIANAAQRKRKVFIERTPFQEISAGILYGGVRKRNPAEPIHTSGGSGDGVVVGTRTIIAVSVTNLTIGVIGKVANKFVGIRRDAGLRYALNRDISPRLCGVACVCKA